MLPYDILRLFYMALRNKYTLKAIYDIFKLTPRMIKKRKLIVNSNPTRIVLPNPEGVGPRPLSIKVGPNTSYPTRVDPPKPLRMGLKEGTKCNHN